MGGFNRNATGENVWEMFLFFLKDQISMITILQEGDQHFKEVRHFVSVDTAFENKTLHLYSFQMVDKL